MGGEGGNGRGRGSMTLWHAPPQCSNPALCIVCRRKWLQTKIANDLCDYTSDVINLKTGYNHMQIRVVGVS